MTEITREQFDAWKAHPVTRAVYERLRERRQGILEELGAGVTLSLDTSALTQALTAKSVSARETIDQILNLTIEDVLQIHEEPHDDD